MRYTFRDLVEMVPSHNRMEFTKIYEYLHKIENKNDNDILEKVSHCFGINPKDIKADVRFAEVVLARNMYVTTIKVCTTKTLAEIARTVNKDHATVCHALKTMRRDYEYNSVRRNKIRSFIEVLDPAKQELLLDFFNERNPSVLAKYSVNADRVTTSPEYAS